MGGEAMTDFIDHAAEARRVLQLPTSMEDSTEENALAYAQVHATLAVAEQMRVANRIALGVPVELLGEDGMRVCVPVWKITQNVDGLRGIDLAADIAASLGIEEES